MVSLGGAYLLSPQSHLHAKGSHYTPVPHPRASHSPGLGKGALFYLDPKAPAQRWPHLLLPVHSHRPTPSQKQLPNAPFPSTPCRLAKEEMQFQPLEEIEEGLEPRTRGSSSPPPWLLGPSSFASHLPLLPRKNSSASEASGAYGCLCPGASCGCQASKTPLGWDEEAVAGGGATSEPCSSTQPLLDTVVPLSPVNSPQPPVPHWLQGSLEEEKRA